MREARRNCSCASGAADEGIYRPPQAVVSRRRLRGSADEQGERIAAWVTDRDVLQNE